MNHTIHQFRTLRAFNRRKLTPAGKFWLAYVVILAPVLFLMAQLLTGGV